MSLRTDLVDYLTGLVTTIPELATLQVIPAPRAIAEITVPHLIVKTDQLTKNPAAPLSTFQGTFTLTLVSPHRDLTRAEDHLEALLEALLPALFTWGMSWQDATQVAYDQNLAYDIRTTSIYKKGA